jgi:hypothetical protein
VSSETLEVEAGALNTLFEKSIFASGIVVDIGGFTVDVVGVS